MIVVFEQKGVRCHGRVDRRGLDVAWRGTAGLFTAGDQLELEGRVWTCISVDASQFVAGVRKARFQ